MAVKSGKNSLSVARFRAALTNILAKSGQTRKEFAQNLGINYSTLTSVLNGSVPASIALMDEFAEKIDRELSDILLEGRKILAEGDDHIENICGANEHENFSPEQRQAIEAMKVLLESGDDIHEPLIKLVVDTAEKIKAKEGFNQPTEKRRSA